MKKRRQKRFNLIDQYKKCWRYLNESKNYLVFIIGLFFFSGFIGFFVPAPDWVYEKIVEFISELLKETENLGQFGLIKYIFLNNVQSGFFVMIFGLFFGIFPIISTVLNGYLLGFVSYFAAQTEGISVLLQLLPHGIFELPAIFISFALGIKLGTIPFKDKKRETFLNYIRESLRVFFFVILPLLVIAAIIEGSLIFLGK